MRGFIIVNDKNLSDIFLDNLNSRALLRLLNAKVDIPEEISSVYHGKYDCVLGVTLWKDPIDGDHKVSHSIMIPHIANVDEHLLSNISSAVSKARDIANAYFVSIAHDGDVFIGIVHYSLGNKDKAANHYDELVRISKLMDDYNVPVVHYFPKNGWSDGSNRVLVIAKVPHSLAASSLASLAGDDIENFDEYKKHLQDADKYILAKFLTGVIKGKERSKIYIRRANIL